VFKVETGQAYRVDSSGWKRAFKEVRYFCTFDHHCFLDLLYYSELCIPQVTQHGKVQ